MESTSQQNVKYYAPYKASAVAQDPDAHKTRRMMKLLPRFINMTPEQLQRRRKRKNQQEHRRQCRKEISREAKKQKGRTPKHRGEKNKKKRIATERSLKRKDRPCCGLRYDKCTCKAPPGMRVKPVNALAKRFLYTPLNTVQDTTDVSAWQDLMRDRCKALPTSAILGYSYIHVVFNQQCLLKAMVKEKAFIFRSPWVDWKKLEKIIGRNKKQKRVIRSSNFHAATLQNVMLQSGHSKVNVPKSGVARDVLACKLVGFAAMPVVVCDLYDSAPSRDLWKAMLQQWLSQVNRTCTGAMGHYYMKCCLDRLFAVKDINPGTVSWWPTQCPSYVTWYKNLYRGSKDFDEEDHFQILCAIYRKLNGARCCSFPDALAQTCWSMKEEKGTLELK